MSGQVGTQHVVPVTHALSAGCSGSPGVGLARTELGSGVGVGVCRGSRWGRRQGCQERGRKGGCGGSIPKAGFTSSSACKRVPLPGRGHHVVCDREFVRDTRAAAEQAWVDAIEILVPKEAVLCPVLSPYSGGTAGTSLTTHSPSGSERTRAEARGEGGRPWTTEISGGSSSRPRPPVEPPEGRRAWRFPEEPPEARSPVCEFRPPVLCAAPSPHPTRGSCLPPAARAPGARSRPLPRSRSHTEDDRFIARENFLNILQSLPGPFAVHQAMEFEPQCPRTGDSGGGRQRWGSSAPGTASRAAPPPTPRVS